MGGKNVAPGAGREEVPAKPPSPISVPVPPGSLPALPDLQKAMLALTAGRKRGRASEWRRALQVRN